MKYSTYALGLFLFFSIPGFSSSESSLQLRARVPSIESMQVRVSQNQLIVTRRSNILINRSGSNLNIEIDDGINTQKQSLSPTQAISQIALNTSLSDSLKISFIQQ